MYSIGLLAKLLYCDPATSMVGLMLSSGPCAPGSVSAQVPSSWHRRRNAPRRTRSAAEHKCKGVGKVAISDQYLAIARKRLKIDGYMLLCV